MIPTPTIEFASHSHWLATRFWDIRRPRVCSRIVVAEYFLTINGCECIHCLLLSSFRSARFNNRKESVLIRHGGLRDWNLRRWPVNLHNKNILVTSACMNSRTPCNIFVLATTCNTLGWCRKCLPASLPLKMLLSCLPLAVGACAPTGEVCGNADFLPLFWQGRNHCKLLFGNDELAKRSQTNHKNKQEATANQPSPRDQDREKKQCSRATSAQHIYWSTKGNVRVTWLRIRCILLSRLPNILPSSSFFAFLKSKCHELQKNQAEYITKALLMRIKSTFRSCHD